jgi:hypothetical protein
VATVTDHYRGIHYAVRQISRETWKWEVRPPNGIKGLRFTEGEVVGSIEDAISAAKREIAIQAPEVIN